MNNRFTENITKEDIQALPLQAFEGEINVIETEEDCNEAVHILNKESVIGFDTEAKPAFNKGEYNHTALVQLSTLDEAFLFRLNKMGYPKSLFNLFENESILKLGISITDDLKDLQKVRKFMPGSFVDMNDVARDLGVVHMGVKKLAAIFLDARISKNQQVSNWENETLSPAQQKYAATDAWICLAIHDELRKRGYA
ncbi:3'-5' exonuclease [Ekhidna sp.]